MAQPLSEEVSKNLHELIARITKLPANSDDFKRMERSVCTQIRKSDTMYFLTKRDIEMAINSMGEKFEFHGFTKHSDYLKTLHGQWIEPKLKDSELIARLNMVKFLLCTSERPTHFFWDSLEQFQFIPHTEPEEEMDWGAYLNEGIEIYMENIEDSVEKDSDSENDNLSDSERTVTEDASTNIIIKEEEKIEIYNFENTHKALLGIIQGQEQNFKPSSERFEANVAILWHKYIVDEVGSLILIPPITIIPEYNAIREILWQMWGPHDSHIFELKGNDLFVRENITISSVREMAFRDFMVKFIEKIEIVHELRTFSQMQFGKSLPETYRSYAFALKKIIEPFFHELTEIEEEVREQEKTMTLVMLQRRLCVIFEPIGVLSKIHQEIVIDFEENSALECALTLLTRLRKSLMFTENKLEQDLRLTIYLESLYYFLNVINAWLVRNDLQDSTQEFIIENKNEKNRTCFEWQMNFFLRKNAEKFANDGIVRIISEKVLKIGRNLHLLRLLGRYEVLGKNSENIHQEFVRKILEELSNFYGEPLKEAEPPIEEATPINTILDSDWRDLVDPSDGFLQLAFEEEIEQAIPTNHTLFQRISATTKALYPLQNLPEMILFQILEDRFTISGLMVKNLLIENYQLDKQFKFLNHIFLFSDNLIFPFYTRLFEKFNTPNSNWGNNLRLTSHLQDIIMDVYPNMYEDCIVQVREYWRECFDSISACGLINLSYSVKWPLNLIITNDHLVLYGDLFQFVLKMKWALFTVNHLSFLAIEPKLGEEKTNVFFTKTKRLKLLRFCLINLMNSIQHYVYGYVIMKCRRDFELQFEKANDLGTLFDAHDAFIKSVHGCVVEVRSSGFNQSLKCVQILKGMWNCLEHATNANLDKCQMAYKVCSESINSIVNPIYVFDY